MNKQNTKKGPAQKNNQRKPPPPENKVQAPEPSVDNSILDLKKKLLAKKTTQNLGETNPPQPITTTTPIVQEKPPTPSIDITQMKREALQKKLTLTGNENKIITLNSNPRPTSTTTPQEQPQQITKDITKDKPVPPVNNTVVLNTQKQVPATGRVVLTTNSKPTVVSGLNPGNSTISLNKPNTVANINANNRTVSEGTIPKDQAQKEWKTVEKPQNKQIVLAKSPKIEEVAPAQPQTQQNQSIKDLKSQLMASLSKPKEENKIVPEQKIIKQDSPKEDKKLPVVEETKAPTVEKKDIVVEEPPKVAEVKEVSSPHSPQDLKTTAAKSNGDTPVESQGGEKDHEDIINRKDSSHASPDPLNIETHEGKPSEQVVQRAEVEEIIPSPEKLDEEENGEEEGEEEEQEEEVEETGVSLEEEGIEDDFNI